MELQCIPGHVTSRAEATRNSCSSVRRYKYQNSFSNRGFRAQFHCYSPLQTRKSPLNFTRKDVISSKLRCMPAYCAAQLPEVGAGVKQFIESTNLKSELITNNLINAGKVLHPSVLEIVQGAENWASILLQDFFFNIKHFNSGADVLKLSHSVQRVLERAELLSTYLSSQLGNLVAGIVEDPEKLRVLAGQIGTALGTYSGNFSTLPVPVAGTAIATLASSLLLASASNKKTEGTVNGDILPLRYEFEAIAAYFKKRPLDVFSRSLEVVLEFSYVAVNLAIDRSTGMIKENEKQRAAEVVDLINKLGPTAIKVLITEWVEGEKLSESKAGDLLLLVNTALNCYLMQLLESGFLHADPHPGNLLRTADGCLCVLDYGLMTEVTDDLAKISEDYVFVIPPYFALILKAFSVLEGIGLEADPDYAIINDCYPYLSKRLITDDRTSSCVLGGVREKQIVNIQTFEQVSSNFHYIVLSSLGSYLQSTHRREWLVGYTNEN